jgi:hypothetical protein
MSFILTLKYKWNVKFTVNLTQCLQYFFNIPIVLIKLITINI